MPVEEKEDLLGDRRRSYSTIIMTNRLDVPTFSSLTRSCIVEFIGLLIFVLIGTLQASSGGDTPVLVAAAAHGITIALLIASMGHISGGHFNPAVSVGVFLSGHMSLLKAVAYVISQLLGAFCGSLLARCIVHQEMWNAIGGGLTLPVDADLNSLQGILLEGILTFLLVNSVLLSAVDTDTNWLAPFAIGLTVFVDILAGGALTGASMNPARSLGPAVVGIIFPVSTPGALSCFHMHYIYWAGPMAGAVVAAMLYKTVLGNENRRWLLN